MVTTVTDNSPQAINTSLFSLEREIEALKQNIERIKASLNDLDVGVVSVNDKTGKVELTAEDVGALPSDTHIPTDPVQSNWAETDTSSLAYIENKPNLATVATSGSYGDLSNKPTIPTKTSDLTNDSSFATTTDITNAINDLDASSVGGDGKYIESISESNGIINAVEKKLSNIVPLKNGIVMDNLDLNAYVECGLYVTKDNEVYTNIPNGMNGNYFSLMVVASAKYTGSLPDYPFRNQILYKYDTAEIYTRTYSWRGNGLAWQDWRKVVFQDELGSSLDEQRIGTWIDGKPLYKKAIVLNVPQNGEYSIPINVSGTFHVVKWFGNFFQGGYDNPNFIMHIPYTYISDTNPNDVINIYCYYGPSTNSFIYHFYGLGQYAGGYFNGQAVLYVEYTKG